MKPLWQPNPNTFSQTHLFRFMQTVGKNNYNELYQWSIDHPADFWEKISAFCEIIFSKKPTTILQPALTMQKTKWFLGAKLNFAKNLLWRQDDHTALIYADEKGVRKTISYRDLSSQVQALSEHLRALGIQPGDRIAGFVTNSIETVIAMLATTAIGAIWSACGPEFGLEALIERFSQIEPVVLFAVTEHGYQGKKFIHHETLKQLQKKVPTIKHIINTSNMPLHKNNNTGYFTDTDFDHPIYILYTSGTTGKPKCIVHGAGNVLIQHKKELMLHTDLHENDTIFFYSSCSWMMWNWMISSLSVGATVVLYDGSPLFPQKTTLFDLNAF